MRENTNKDSPLLAKLGASDAPPKRANSKARQHGTLLDLADVSNKFKKRASILNPIIGLEKRKISKEKSINDKVSLKRR